MTIVNYKEFFELANIKINIPELNTMGGKYRDGATNKQKQFLHKLGVGWTGLAYKGQITIVIDAALDRERKGLATPGQMRKLRNLGLRDVSKITFKDAADILDKLSYS